MEGVKSLKNFGNGRTIYDTLRYMENLIKAGVDMFDVDLKLLLRSVLSVRIPIH